MDNNQVSLDAAEMKDFIQHIIDNNRYIQKQGKKPVATEIIGDSGLGKTSVALQIAEENGLNFVKVNLAQIEELGDLVGFPVRQFKLVPPATKTVLKKFKTAEGKIVEKTVKVAATNTEPEWIDENAVEHYVKQGYEFTGKKRMSYCPPEWIADIEGGGVLILDDWNRADIRFIQAVMELVDRQEYISWSLPEDWHILLTANPDNGEYLVNSIDTAQRTRFISVVMKWNHERWAEWAETEGIDGRCINFVLMHPEVVTARVNPRSITTFFNSISSFQNFNQRLPMIQMIGEGSVGPELATIFATFIKNRLDKLISPKEVILGTDDQVVIDGLTNAITEGNPNEYRADIASLLTTRIVNWTINYSQSNPITPEILDRVSMLIKNDDIFTDDLKYHIVKKIINGNKQKFQKLLFDTTIQEIATK